MARNRTPENLRIIKGMDKKNPSRRNPNEPLPVTMEIGSAPSHMSASESLIWDEIIEMMPKNVLGSSDRIALELIVKITSEVREDFTEVTGAKISQLTSLLSRFGMTPSDRSKLSVPKEKAINPFSEIEKEYAQGMQ